MLHSRLMQLTRQIAETVTHDRQRGVMCGAIAEMMRVAAVADGIEAYGLNCGQREGPDHGRASHVTVVARNEQGYAIYDPMLGRYIGTIDQIMAGRAPVIYVADRRPWMIERELLPVARRLDPGAVPVEQPDGRYLVQIGMKAFAHAMDEVMLAWLKTKLPNPSLADLFRFPLSTTGEATIENITRQLAAPVPGEAGP
jgi:hypothetical protein